MAEPPPGFIDVVSGLDPALVVVTAMGAGSADGCVVGFHCQASIDPPRYVVWLSNKNRTYRLASDPAATHLAVHHLTVEDHDVAELFGGETGDEVDKLAQVDWSPGPGGAPLLDRLPTRFVGRILARLPIEGTDHMAFVLDPVDAELGTTGARPLRLSDAADIDAGHDA